jgi:hypothetical protein
VLRDRDRGPRNQEVAMHPALIIAVAAQQRGDQIAQASAARRARQARRARRAAGLVTGPDFRPAPTQPRPVRPLPGRQVPVRPAPAAASPAGLQPSALLTAADRYLPRPAERAA